MNKTGIFYSCLVLVVGLVTIFLLFAIRLWPLDPLTTPDAVRYFIEASGQRAYQRNDSIWDAFYFPITEVYGSFLGVFYSLGLQSSNDLVVVNYLLNIGSGIIFCKIANLKNNHLYYLAALWCVISPIVLDHSAQLLKESLVLFLLTVTIYASISKHTLLMVATLAFGSLIRPYFLFYYITYLIIATVKPSHNRMIVSYIVLNFCVCIALVIWKPFVYLVSVAALLFIPKFWSMSNLTHFLPQVIEANIVTLLFLIAAFFYSDRRLPALIFLITCANLFILISDWRVMFAEATWASDSVLADNFYRKKVPLILLQLLFFIEAFGSNSYSQIKQKYRRR